MRTSGARITGHLPGIVNLILLVLMLTGCDSGEPTAVGPRYSKTPGDSGTTVYLLAIHPLHNPAKLTEAYQPLIDYLNKNINEGHFELEASRNYQVYESKFRAREASFLLPNPWQTLQAQKVGYRVIAQAGDPNDFRGIFIVRKDSKLRTITDLKGEIVSYPSPTALAACIMPQEFLHRQGIDINRDLENRYVGSQESSIMHAYLGQAAAGATWPPPWRAFQKDHPEEAAKLKVIWSTPPLMNNSVMVRDDVPSGIAMRVQQLLLDLHKTEQGKQILAGMETARFHSATDKSYEPVRRFIERFERDVRPVEQS